MKKIAVIAVIAVMFSSFALAEEVEVDEETMELYRRNQLMQAIESGDEAEIGRLMAPTDDDDASYDDVEND